MENAAHDLTTDANNRLREEVSKLEDVNQRLRNVLEERKAGYEEQLKHEQEEAQQVRIRLENEKGQLVDRHEREAEIWAKMREQYEEAAALYKQEIMDVKNALQHAQNHAQAVKENIRIVLQTNREKFSAQLKAAMDKG